MCVCESLGVGLVFGGGGGGVGRVPDGQLRIGGHGLPQPLQDGQVLSLRHAAQVEGNDLWGEQQQHHGASDGAIFKHG